MNKRKLVPRVVVGEDNDDALTKRTLSSSLSYGHDDGKDEDIMDADNKEEEENQDGSDDEQLL